MAVLASRSEDNNPSHCGESKANAKMYEELRRAELLATCLPQIVLVRLGHTEITFEERIWLPLSHM